MDTNKLPVRLGDSQTLPEDSSRADPRMGSTADGLGGRGEAVTTTVAADVAAPGVAAAVTTADGDGAALLPGRDGLADEPHAPTRTPSMAIVRNRERRGCTGASWGC